jgi:hypothetical protein
MFWYKGWLETRFRLLFLIGFTMLILFFQYSVRNAATPPGVRTRPSDLSCPRPPHWS